jgi:proline iminopeptidase
MKGLEDDVAFAVWDQRGTGASYGALDPTSTATLDQAAADTVELTNYLRQRFRQRQECLFGNSWGTILGLLAVQRHPELYAAFIGSGQMVSVRDSDQRIYAQSLDYAARTHDPALPQQMRAWGEPSYRDIYANAFLIEYYDKLEPCAKTRYFETQGPGAWTAPAPPSTARWTRSTRPRTTQT